MTNTKKWNFSSCSCQDDIWIMMQSDKCKEDNVLSYSSSVHKKRKDRFFDLMCSNWFMSHLQGLSTTAHTVGRTDPNGTIWRWGQKLPNWRRIWGRSRRRQILKKWIQSWYWVFKGNLWCMWQYWNLQTGSRLVGFEFYQETGFFVIGNTSIAREDTCNRTAQLERQSRQLSVEYLCYWKHNCPDH